MIKRNDCSVSLLQGVFFFIFYVLRHDRVRPRLTKALTSVRKWCWHKCFVCYREEEAELMPSPTTEEPTPLRQETGDHVRMFQLYIGVLHSMLYIAVPLLSQCCFYRPIQPHMECRAVSGGLQEGVSYSLLNSLG